MTLIRKTRATGAPDGGALSRAALALLAVLAVGSPMAAQTGPIVTYAGALNQDGCPDCCRFSCRLTPTPTPHIDASGRRVFERSAGRFLFLVEAAPGASLRAPSVGGTRRGEVIESLGGRPRPGLQVRFNRALGNGSTFVECGTTIPGGIPSFVGLNETQLTAALRDAACRFEWVSHDNACTRDRFGGFSTLDDDTTVQYCFQVPSAAEFPIGDTVAFIQVMDSFGNLGPVEEIVLRVGTAVPTPTPTPTLSGQFSVGGSITHYASSAAVAGVAVEEVMSGRVSSTSASGGYVLANLPAAAVEIIPRKAGGIGNAVTPLDAARVLQSVAQLRTLTTNQRLACDVTGNGTVSNLDATRILQWTVGLLDRFPVAADPACGSDWAFVPFGAVRPNQTMVAPSMSGGVCRPGSIRFGPLSASAVNQSFLAIPFGDCTGNGPGAAAGQALSRAAAGVRLGRPRHRRGARIEVPVYVDHASSLRGALVEVAWDPALMTARRIRRGISIDDGLMVENRTTPGRLKFAVAALDGGSIGDRPLVVLRFRARPAARRSDVNVRVVSALVEDGDLQGEP